MEVFGAERVEVPAEIEQPAQIRRSKRGGIRRHHAEDGLHRHRHVQHEPAELGCGFSIARRVTVDLPAGLVGIGPRSEVVAIVERCERALKREYLQTVTRQLEIANDLGPEKAHDVGKHRELESRKNLLADGGTAQNLPALKHEHPPAGARQVRCRNQAIVAAADDDHVVAWGVHARFRSGSKNGSLRTIASADTR